MKGTVKWFDNSKGYGFITSPDIEEDIFIYYENIDQPGFKKLYEGDKVTFELIKTDKGLQAKKIKPIYNLQTIN